MGHLSSHARDSLCETLGQWKRAKKRRAVKKEASEKRRERAC